MKYLLLTPHVESLQCVHAGQKSHVSAPWTLSSAKGVLPPSAEAYDGPMHIPELTVKTQHPQVRHLLG